MATEKEQWLLECADRLALAVNDANDALRKSVDDRNEPSLKITTWIKSHWMNVLLAEVAYWSAKTDVFREGEPKDGGN